VRILVVNAGSSSVKLRVLEPDDSLAASADLGAPDAPDTPAALEGAIRRFGRVDAVGHRVVHGGSEFIRATRITAGVRERLVGLNDLAPLHQPASIAGIDAVARILPTVPAAACFDTAFHATLSAGAATYALPAEWRERWPLRRFGFHGLSHAYVARRVAELWQSLPDPRTRRDESRSADLPRPFRIVSCHLGAGASLAAIRGGRSVDTTMGFTPLEGLVMATRSGSVDPGLVLWLQTHGGLSAADVTDALERRSGLLGLAGTADMREVDAHLGSPASDLALDVYVHRLVGLIAAMAAAAGGLDALAFTGGVGEHASLVRQRAADGLAFLGVRLNPGENAVREPRPSPDDHEITHPRAAVRTFVVEAREDLEIAREVRDLLGR
jgi:acetate kinase